MNLEEHLNKLYRHLIYTPPEDQWRVIKTAIEEIVEDQVREAKKVAREHQRLDCLLVVQGFEPDNPTDPAYKEVKAVCKRIANSIEKMK